MTTQQGSLDLLQDPVAQRLLTGPYLARVAYTWTDGTPRVIPIWFHWNGKEIVLGTPPDAPKVKALQTNPKVALTIDDAAPPWKVLLVRGTARVTIADGVSPEYADRAKAGSNRSAPCPPRWRVSSFNPNGRASSTLRSVTRVRSNGPWNAPRQPGSRGEMGSSRKSVLSNHLQKQRALFAGRPLLLPPIPYIPIPYSLSSPHCLLSIGLLPRSSPHTCAL